MSLLEHLEELRKRLLRACIAIAVGVVLSFFYIDRIVAFVFAPMRKALPAGARMIYTAPGEAFGLYVNVALIAGAVLASPFIRRSDGSPWNQTLFAAPMIALYLLSIPIAWAVPPRRDPQQSRGRDSQ